jgi:hypothetical protein
MTMGRAVAIGATGFTLTSIAAYSVWAFGAPILPRSFGNRGLYTACAVVFILLGSFLLRPLTRLSFGKFAAIFTTAFMAYAVAWCASYFVVKGRPGEWAASLVGSVAFCLVLAAWFRAWRGLLVSAAVLFISHSAGYFMGSWSHYSFLSGQGPIAPLAWGFFHGLGMGAGLGFAFYQMQKLQASEIAGGDRQAPIQPVPR